MTSERRGQSVRSFHRRATASVCIVLLLGMLTTIAVSWTLALSVDTILHPEPMTYRQTPAAFWVVQPYIWYGVRSEVWTPLDWAARSGQSPAEFDADAADLAMGLPITTDKPRVARVADLLNAGGDPGNLTEHHRGLPFLALGSAAIIDADPMHRPPGDDSPRSLWALPLKPAASAIWEVDLTHLPLRPLFPGFYINTILYASIWWAILFFRPLRRRRRIARGQCPACAYSLAGLPGGADKCPECGAAKPA